jgi:hypothetical protein
VRLALTLALVFVASARGDDALRCGEWLVSTGASAQDVAKKCGAPSQASRRIDRYRTRYGSRQVAVEVWIYDRGPNEFIRTLTFEDGILKRIESGDYGK